MAWWNKLGGSSRILYAPHVLCPSNYANTEQVPVWAVLDYTNTRTIARELLLVKVSILGPEYLEDQLVGGPSHQPHRPKTSTSESSDLAERETVLAHNFEAGGHPEQETSHPSSPAPLTASEALRNKHQHLQSISVLSQQFGAKIVDVSDHSVIVELTAKTARVEAFLNLLKPFGLLESARTGKHRLLLAFLLCLTLSTS